MAELTVVSAGAGTGKTYDICETISDAIVNGLHPSRILATTYTRKAAAELKTRLQTRLLRDERFKGSKETQAMAELVDLAAVGTVHSVGHQLLTRYAIRLGMSPHLLVLEEEGSNRSLRDLLSSMDLSKWESLATLARKLSIDNPQSLVLQLLDAKRSNQIGAQEFSDQLQQSLERLFEIMSPGGPRPDGVGFERLFGLARSALADIESKTDSTDKTRNAISDLRALCASKEPKWQDYVKAQKLEAGVRSGADECLRPLRAAAAGVRHAPELQQDMRAFVQGLVNEIEVLESEYAKYKGERGLLDFTDLEVQFLGMLQDESLRASLSEDFDLVVVDEFQDTNPIQLAIFQRLKSVARESRWVGDTKQSIFGFRGTDPDLIRGIWDAVPVENRRELLENRRSSKGIVQIVSTLFAPVFGVGAVQNAVIAGAPRAIERWIFESRNKDQDFQSLAVGIAQLRSEGIPLRDIAILARTNSSLKDIGAALHAAGIPALLELPGLFSTREGTLVLCGLRLVADRRDSLAAATIMHLFEDHACDTPGWLEERLVELQKHRALQEEGEGEPAEIGRIGMPWGNHSRLESLGKIDARTLAPSVVVQLVIDALDAGGSLREWGDSARRASHLDAIVQLAKQYEDESLATGSAATLSGLNSRIAKLTAEGKDIRLAPNGLDALTLLTYHTSKGLEWPVVVLADLGAERDPNMWSPVVSGGAAATGNPLAGRTVRFWPWPFGYSNNPFGPPQIIKGSGLEVDALQSIEGQTATAREQQEGLRLLYVGFTRARDKLVLTHRKGKDAWLQQLPGIDTLLDPRLDAGEHELPGIDSTYVLRRLGHAMFDGIRQDGLRSERWLRPLSAASPGSPSHVARYWSPSEDLRTVAPRVAIEVLPGQSIFPSKLPEDKEAALGSACHAYLAALSSQASLDPLRKAEVALRLLKGFCVEAFIPAADIVAGGERFREWVDTKYPGATWITEVPVSAPRLAGGQWLGTIDLLLLLPDGKAVIVDHKASPIRREHCVAKAETYSGQLQAYQEILRAQSLNADTAWIHFPLAGAMAAVGVR
jgi:ATP-dependent helicase/nuclease subunit A